MGAQLHELVTNDMLKTMFPNLNIIANICLSIPVSTASVERSFSQMKMIKTRQRNRIGETSLSHLMKIAVGSPEKLSDMDLENIGIERIEELLCNLCNLFTCIYNFSPFNH